MERFRQRAIAQSRFNKHLALYFPVSNSYVVTGCDTTCASYHQEGFTLLNKSDRMKISVQVFNKCDASTDAAGETFLLALYGAQTNMTNELRHHTFTRAVARCPIQKPVHLASLPPRSAAAQQHSMRVYHGSTMAGERTVCNRPGLEEQ